MKTLKSVAISLTDYQTVNLPQGASVLSVADVDGVISLSVISEDTGSCNTRAVRAIKCGDPVDLPGQWQFVGSIVKSSFSWHIFVEVPENV